MKQMPALPNMNSIPVINPETEKPAWFDHSQSPVCALDRGPLAGLRHRTVIDRRSGSDQLALWQEEHLPGFQVPGHRHDCEEIITVILGEIRAQIDGRYFRVASMQSIVIPSWALHGFQVAGAVPVQLLAIFGSANPGIFRADGSPSIPPWEGGAPDHLET